MRMGHHAETLAPSLADADRVLIYQPDGLDWALDAVGETLGPSGTIHDSIDSLVDTVCTWARQGDHVVVMSNGGFGGIHDRLLDALRRQAVAG
jgi:UDP-N-acetylmuramate: L-alanyl-gamma-D-glutamyl-meso-diaminopimelate ligase